MHTIAKAAKKAGFTLTELAQSVGVAQSFLSAITTYKKPLPVKTAYKIAEITGDDPHALHYQSMYEMVLDKQKKDTPDEDIALIEKMVTFMAWVKHLDAVAQYIVENTNENIRALDELSALTASMTTAINRSNKNSKEIRDILREETEAKQSILTEREKEKA
jgi:plasmid maintenance system antidote protein VapI